MSTAIVTGAGSGIGAAVSSRLVHDGWRVVAVDSDGDRLRSCAAQMPDADRQHHQILVGDVSDSATAQAAADAALASDDFSGLVTCAGIMRFAPLEDATVQEWEEILRTNVLGTFNFIRQAALHMTHNEGSIVTIASVNAFWVEPNIAAYCASKGAIVALTRAAALELGPRGIRCNSVSPGYVDTGMARRYFDATDDPHAERARAAELHALKRIGQAREIAAFAAFLLSPEASFCTGQDYIADGGLSVGSQGQ